jgi:putative DNA primase/helicase
MQPDFREVADSIGCVLRYVREDDKIHRCPTREHPKKQNGSYRTDGQRGWVKNWETGETVTWHAERGGRRSGPPTPLPSLAERRAEEDRTARRAAEKARQMVKAATMTTHPYLERKGFPKAIGLVLDEKLLVPAYVGRDIVSLQEIAADGTKKNLPGGRMSGAHFSIGNGSLEVLCEGYATGLSIRAALGAIHVPGRVTCCFSASNVAEVAGRKRHAIIIADNDRPITTPRVLFRHPETGVPIGAGEHYAIKSGLAFAMPPDVGDDANDLGAKDIFTLQDILLDLMQRRRPHSA